MRVILSTQGILPMNGGIARSVPRLAYALGNLGEDVHLVAPGYGADLDTMLLPGPPVQSHIVRQNILRILPNPWQGRFLTWMWRYSYMGTIKRLIAGGSPVLVHDNGIWLATNHCATVAAKKMKVPLIISSRGMVSEWAMRHRHWRKDLAWRIYQRKDLERADVIHATSEKEADGIRRLGMRQPIAVIPNGVDIPVWKERQPEKAGLKTLLFMSRISPEKGLLLLADAWVDLKLREKWRVRVVGFDQGGYLRQVREHVQKLGIEASFEFPGPVSDRLKWETLCQADAFILPSYTENFGLVVSEALAAGLPVITTHGTPWSELPARGCGWWVPTDAPSLRRALSEMTGLTDDERAAMGKRGRQWMESSFAWPAVARQMRDVYMWILGLGGMPDCISKS
jgi:glycosyltransferase involved in cell wall biosynthesis